VWLLRRTGSLNGNETIHSTLKAPKRESRRKGRVSRSKEIVLACAGYSVLIALLMFLKYLSASVEMSTETPEMALFR
jgi:type III secretory pathway component EscU